MGVKFKLGKNFQDFKNGNELFLSHSLKTTKCNAEDFLPKQETDPPLEFNRAE